MILPFQKRNMQTEAVKVSSKLAPYQNRASIDSTLGLSKNSNGLEHPI